MKNEFFNCTPENYQKLLLENEELLQRVQALEDVVDYYDENMFDVFKLKQKNLVLDFCKRLLGEKIVFVECQPYVAKKDGTLQSIENYYDENFNYDKQTINK